MKDLQSYLQGHVNCILPPRAHIKLDLLNRFGESLFKFYYLCRFSTNKFLSLNIGLHLTLLYSFGRCQIFQIFILLCIISYKLHKRLVRKIRNSSIFPSRTLTKCSVLNWLGRSSFHKFPFVCIKKVVKYSGLTDLADT